MHENETLTYSYQQKLQFLLLSKHIASMYIFLNHDIDLVPYLLRNR